jgi:glycosidase
MQWDDSIFAGFSTVKPWLPVHPDYIKRNVAVQSANPDSLYHFTKKLIALRKEYPALRRGEFVPLTDCPRGVLAYLRRTDEQTVLVAMNFGTQSAKISNLQGNWRPLLTNDASRGSPLELAPYAVHLAVKS